MARAQAVLYADPRGRKDGKLSIKIRITFGKQEYITLGLYYTKEEWAIIQNREISQKKNLGLDATNLNKIRVQLDAQLSAVNEAISELDNRRVQYSANDVVQLVGAASPRGAKVLLFEDIFNSFVEDSLQKNKSSKTIDSYTTTKNNLSKFVDEQINGGFAKFQITSIDTPFLYAFEKHLAGNGLSLNSVSVYIRSIRTIYNFAITQKIISGSLSPFEGGDKYKIPVYNKSKRVLPKSNLINLFDIRNELSEAQKRALDYFFFSFLCGGANMIDIAQFRYSDIDDSSSTLSFIRQKTYRSKGITSNTLIQLTQHHWDIINRIGNKDKSGYIFPILGEKYDTPKKVSDRVDSFVGNISERLRLIAKRVGVETITYQFARHSFATIAKQNSVPLAEISDLMSHSSIKTTENYLHTLPPEKKTNVTKMMEDLFSPNTFK